MKTTNRFAIVLLALASLPVEAGPPTQESTVTGRASVRYQGRVYETLYERQIEDGRPIEIYFYQPSADSGAPAVVNGQQIWSRFVRDPAADHPDQSRVVWWSSRWEYQKGEWKRIDTRDVVVEVLSRSAQPGANTARAPIEIRSVTIDPPRTRAGAEVAFVVAYDIAGAEARVVERREIVKDGQVLATWEDSFTRPAGGFTSEKPVRVAPQATAGRYSARVTLSAGGKEYRQEFEFEVQ
jgi:hypothetical protein